MTTQEIHFVYWLQEKHNLRGLANCKSTQEKFVKIAELNKEFFNEYPNGILTGFKQPNTPYLTDADEKEYYQDCLDEQTSNRKMAKAILRNNISKEDAPF